MIFRRALTVVLSVLLLAGVLATSPRAASAQEATNDELRELAVADAIAAFEAYGDASDTYQISDAGYQGSGSGLFSLVDGVDYLESLSGELVAQGHLDALAVPADPTVDLDPANDFWVFLCADRVGVFSLSEGISPAADDQQWWDDNACTRDPFDVHNRTYFQLAQPLSGPTDDDLRITALGEIITAYENYGVVEGTYRIDGAGFQQTGEGRFSAENEADYLLAIDTALVNAGIFDAAALPQEPTLDQGPDQDFEVYLCADRVGVFSLSDGVLTEADDQQWWTDNACTDDAIVAGKPYFQLSTPVDSDPHRLVAVDEVVVALEAYATDNYTYTVAGSGYQDLGYGWFSADDVDQYQVSIADALVAGGYLDAGSVPEEPTLFEDHSAGFIVHQCGDRAGVFSLAGGIAPTTEDASWWTDNNCTTEPIDNGHTYFRLTSAAPAAPLTDDEIRALAVDEIVTALEAYAADNLRFAIAGAGRDRTGDGWFSASGITDYSVAISTRLGELGYLDSNDLPADPIPGYENGFRIVICGERAVVLARPSSPDLVPLSDDADWVDANDCAEDEIAEGWTYFKLTGPSGHDAARIAAVAVAVDALDAYAAVNYTHGVFGAGRDDTGTGWFALDGFSDYPHAISDRLIDQGFLDAAARYEDPLAEVNYRHGFAVWLCADRGAVFSYSNGIVPSAEDAAWWSDNNCSTALLDQGFTYFQLTDPAPDADAVRVEGVSNLVAALEAYALDNYTPSVFGAGYKYEARGYASLQDGYNYRRSITGALIDGGYLDPAAVREDPTIGDTYQRGFVIQLCGQRAAVFSYSNGIETSAEDEAWWSANNCGRSTADHTYFQVTAPAPDPDPLREVAVSNLIIALEDYAVDNYTPSVLGAGYKYEARGYASLQDGYNYRRSITGALIDGGYLEPHWAYEDPTLSGRYQRGFVIQLCGQRAAVFSLSNGIETSAEDEAWWSANNCGRSTADHTYFQVTRPAPTADPLREADVAELVAALEAFGEDNYTYTLTGAGYQNRGYGYVNVDGDANYSVALSTVLADGGYLDRNDIPVEPTRFGDNERGYNMRVCGDRAAIFSLSDEIEPSPEDLTWWTDNGCSTNGAAHSYFQITQPAPDPDPLREADIAELVAALEAFAEDNYTYTLTGAGYQNQGYGYVNVDGDANYSVALSTVLADGGYLDPNDLPAEPARLGDNERGYNMRVCGDRAAVFSLSNGIEPSTEDLAWWTDNGCSTNGDAHSYFQVTAPARVAENDDLREDAVSQVLAALESYGAENLTYKVSGGGSQGNGQGWYQRDNDGSYPDSIMGVLIAEGHLDGDNVLVDPLDTVVDAHSSYDFMVYRCADRVAVFAKADTITSSVEDANWWADNGCTRQPIDRHDHPYFQLSAPLPLDDARVIAVSQAVDALESYGAENLTYRVDGGGSRGNGQGWYQRGNVGAYPDSIMGVLIAEGHLDGDNVLVDPLDTVVDAHSSYDFMVYRCADRVAVFSQTQALTPSTADANWWADNGCTRRPIDRHDHPYFQLSAPLPLDDARTIAVSQAVAALESYGLANGTYRVDGGGSQGNGQGWYQRDNDGSYPDSIMGVLIAEGHLDGDNVLVDPLDTVVDAHSSYDFMVYRCADRVGVFSKTQGLAPSVVDETWWTDNGCTRQPIDRHDHTYFQLAAPLPALTEPVTVEYSDSPTPGYKVATIMVRPQGETVGLVIGAVSIAGSTDASQGAGGGPLAFAAFQDGVPEQPRCVDGVICSEGDDGVVRFLDFDPEGWDLPFPVIDWTVPESDLITVDMASLTVDEMLQGGFADDTDFTYFAADAADILDYVGTPAGAFGTGYQGLDKNEGTYQERCEYSLFRPGLAWTDFYMEFPTDVELKAADGGLRWEWSVVEYSRDCYEWKAWAKYKNGNLVPISTVYGFETGRYSNVPGGHLADNVAELCINVSGLTWLDQTWYEGEGRRAYWGQNHPFHPQPRSEGDVCVPAPHDWGDTNCDGKVDFTDIAAYGSNDVIIEVIGSAPNSECSTAFDRDVNWDGVVDFRDGEFIFDCLMKAQDGVQTEDCSRLNIVIEEATNADEAEIEENDDGVPEAKVPPSPSGSEVEVTADGEKVGPTVSVGPDGGSVSIGGATGNVCVTVRQTGAGSAAGSSTTCVQVAADSFAVSSECGTGDAVFSVTNTSESSTRTYELRLEDAEPGTTTRIIFVDVEAGATGDKLVRDVGNGSYNASVKTVNGPAVGDVQPVTVADCDVIQISSVFCNSNSIVVRVEHNDPLTSDDFPITALDPSSSIFAFDGTLTVPVGGEDELTIPNLPDGTFDIAVTRSNGQLPLLAVRSTQACGEADYAGFTVLGEDPDGNRINWNPYTVPVDELLHYSGELKRTLGGGNNWEPYLAHDIVHLRLLQGVRPSTGYTFNEVDDLHTFGRLTTPTILPGHITVSIPTEIAADAEIFRQSVHAQVTADFRSVIQAANFVDVLNPVEVTRSIAALNDILGIGALELQPDADANDFVALGLVATEYDDALGRLSFLTEVQEFLYPVPTSQDPFEESGITEREQALGDALQEARDDLAEMSCMLIDSLCLSSDVTPWSQTPLYSRYLIAIADFDPSDVPPAYASLVPEALPADDDDAAPLINESMWLNWWSLSEANKAKLPELQSLAQQLVANPVAFNMISGAASSGSAIARGEIPVDRGSVRGKVTQDDIAQFNFKVWIEPYLREYIDDIDAVTTTTADGTISIRDWENFLLLDDGADPEDQVVPEFIRREILTNLGSLADKTAFDTLVTTLQFGSLVLGILVNPAGGLAAPFGRIVFAASIAAQAGEVAVAIATEDDLGLLLSVGGILFDGLDALLLARNGVRGAADASGATIGDSAVRASDATNILPEGASYTLGDTIAATRKLINSDPRFEWSEVLSSFDAKRAATAADDNAERGLALAMIANAKAPELLAASAGMTPEQARDLIDGFVAREADRLSDEAARTFRNFRNALDNTPADELATFTDHVLSAMEKGWSNLDLTFEEMAALHRATVASSSLTRDDLYALYISGKRHDPSAPGSWPRIAAADFQPATRNAMDDGQPDFFSLNELDPVAQADIGTKVADRNTARLAGENVTDLSAELGEDLARAGLAARYPGSTPEVVAIFQTPNNTGMFDLVYRVTDANGDSRLVVVEAKGASTTGPKFPVRTIDGVRFQQGHPEYFLDILRAMAARSNLTDNAALNAIREAALMDELDFLLVTGRHLNDPTKTGVHFSSFELPSNETIADTIQAFGLPD